MVFHADLPARGADAKADEDRPQAALLHQERMVTASFSRLRYFDFILPGRRPCSIDPSPPLRSSWRRLTAAARAARQERRPVHGARPRHRAADDLQLRRPHAGPRDPQGQLQAGRQPAAVQLGQHADRSHVGRAAVPHRPRQARRARHDLPARQAADAVLERAERDRRRGDDRDHLLHQRHLLVGRLRLHRRTETRRR